MKILIHPQILMVAQLKFGDKELHPTLWCACDYLSMLELQLMHVSKRGPWLEGSSSDNKTHFVDLYWGISKTPLNYE